MYLKSLMSHLILKSLMNQLNQMNPKFLLNHLFLKLLMTH
jgi:hypothetical protein